MDSLAFVASVAIVLVALHAVVAAYLYRAALPGDRGRDDRDESTDRRATYPTDRWLEATDGAHEATGSSETDETRQCHTCGSANEPGYQFCRNCVADLSGSERTPVSDGAGRLGS